MPFFFSKRFFINEQNLLFTYENVQKFKKYITKKSIRAEIVRRLTKVSGFCTYFFLFLPVWVLLKLK